jgi:drug/metabolite transporter (DMT)-like permease
MWPLLGTRAGSLAFVGALMLIRRERLQATRPDVPGIAAAGLLDFGANILYVLATRTGLLAIAAVLTSLYPAGTVLLARVVLREKLTPAQLVGLALGGAGVVMIGLA